MPPGGKFMEVTARLLPNEPAPPLRNISTSGVHVSERREFWESGGSFLFGPLQLEQQSSDPFEANFSYTGIGDLLFCRLASRVPHRVFRTQAVANHDDRPFLKAVLQTRGRSVITQAGRTTPLDSGEWTVYDAGQPYTFSLSAGGEFSMLLLPRAKLVPHRMDLSGVALRRFPADRGIGKLIWGLVGNTVDEIPELQGRSGVEVAEIVATITRVGLLHLVDGDRDLEHSRDALRERVKFYISTHLNDPELSIEKLAGLARCSKRYLHMIFRPENRSISDYILQERLERCRADLLDPRLARRSITEIAYTWGFNSSNHFSRCFKREFGISPRELRSDRAWPVTAFASASKLS